MKIPACNYQGIVFDNAALMDFLFRYQVDPVSRISISSRDVIRLHMAKDDEGRCICPILTKPFSDRSKIVAILQPDADLKEAYVYSYDAYNELVLKPRKYQDLTTGISFDPKKDLLILSDPGSEELNRLRDINNFYHIRNMRELEKAEKGSSSGNVRLTVTSARIMGENKKKENPTSE